VSITVLLAEDNALLRHGLSRLIDSAADLELVGAAADLGAASRSSKSMRPMWSSPTSGCRPVTPTRAWRSPAVCAPKLDALTPREIDTAQRAYRGRLRVERPPQPSGDQIGAHPTPPAQAIADALAENTLFVNVQGALVVRPSGASVGFARAVEATAPTIIIPRPSRSRCA
jgi:hypothetical protein